RYPDRIILRQGILPDVAVPDVVEASNWLDATYVYPSKSPLVSNEEVNEYLEALGLEPYWPDLWHSPLVRISDPDSAKSAADTVDMLNQRPDLFWAVGYNGAVISPEPAPPELSPFWRYTMFEGEWRKSWMGKVRDLQMPWIQVEDI